MTITELEALMIDKDCKCKACQAGRALCAEWRMMRAALKWYADNGEDGWQDRAAEVLAKLGMQE